jgi:hypothetical protein
MRLMLLPRSRRKLTGHFTLITITRVPPIEHDPRRSRIIQARRLLRGMIPEPRRHELFAVGRAQVQAVGGPREFFFCQDLLLRADDGLDDSQERGAHLVEREGDFAVVFAAGAEEGEVEGGDVFRVGVAPDALEEGVVDLLGESLSLLV